MVSYYHENYLNKAVGVYCLGATSTQTEYIDSVTALAPGPSTLSLPPCLLASVDRMVDRRREPWRLQRCRVFLFLVAVDTEARLPASCVGDVQLLEQLGVPS